MSEKMAVFAPIPKASAERAVIVKVRFCSSVRNEYLRSLKKYPANRNSPR